VTGANVGAVFVEIPVDRVVAAVLDNPAPSVGGQTAFGVSLFGGLAGNAERPLDGVYSTFLIKNLELDHENLAHIAGSRDSRAVRCCTRYDAFQYAPDRAA